MSFTKLFESFMNFENWDQSFRNIVSSYLRANRKISCNIILCSLHRSAPGWFVSCEPCPQTYIVQTLLRFKSQAHYSISRTVR